MFTGGRTKGGATVESESGWFVTDVLELVGKTFEVTAYSCWLRLRGMRWLVGQADSGVRWLGQGRESIACGGTE